GRRTEAGACTDRSSLRRVEGDLGRLLRRQSSINRPGSLLFTAREVPETFDETFDESHAARYPSSALHCGETE
ncbi:MAG TPA: hypothetical protein VEJ89_12420, partial [Myxococcaceae bacterium]|nr:hypothetical protein [Myxococcaceae bacterium]